MELAIYDLQALEKPEEPHQRRFKTNDGTIESWASCFPRTRKGCWFFATN